MISLLRNVCCVVRACVCACVGEHRRCDAVRVARIAGGSHRRRCRPLAPPAIRDVSLFDTLFVSPSSGGSLGGCHRGAADPRLHFAVLHLNWYDADSLSEAGDVEIGRAAYGWCW